MKYTQIQRKPTDCFVTIGEYIQETNARKAQTGPWGIVARGRR